MIYFVVIGIAALTPVVYAYGLAQKDWYGRKEQPGLKSFLQSLVVTAVFGGVALCILWEAIHYDWSR